MKNKKLNFIFFLIVLFAGRLVYGLCSEFWFEDELQIYLIGLKSYTTQTWPYYGPDVVYTQTQIAGAFQGLIISAPLYILPCPEAPTILLNILSFLSLGLLAFYISKRITTIPRWLIWMWVMGLTWTMDYSTRVVNPSYVIVFAVPFFLSVIEILPVYSTNIFSRKLCFFLLGICTCLIMQLHLSYVLLFPFIGLAFFFDLRSSIKLKQKCMHIFLFLTGTIIGLSTLIPTWLLNDNSKSISSNVVFNPDNYQNFVLILMRYLSFASFEIPFMLGGSTKDRLEIINSNIWMAPFTAYLLIFGFLVIAVFLIAFFKYKSNGPWLKIKYLALFTFIILFMSFFFSIKAPSSHTYCILLPLPVIYSFYCYEWLWLKYKVWKNLMYAAMVSAVFFYLGFGLYNYKHKSLYKNRAKVEQAIEQKNYKLVDQRRADKWGYGY